MKKVAVILSGCGFLDGSEITEAISTLICLDEQGTQYECFAPDKDFPAVNHLNGESSQEPRNALIESARICRGNIKNINELKTDDFDAVVIPGGFGSATNLSSWKDEGAQCSILPPVETLLKEFHQQSKPIGAICISPVLVAKVLGSQNPCLTIGNDEGTAQELEKTGAEHENCPATDYITDRETKVITTPAYMYDTTPYQVFQGIRGLIKELCEMA